MKRTFSLSQKLTFSSVLYIIPAAVLLQMMYGARSNDISFAEKEIIGNAYERPLISLLEHVSRHKIVAQRALNGDPEAKTQLGALESQADADLASVREVDQKYGVTLEFTDEGLGKRKENDFRYSKIFAQWDSIKSAKSGLTASSSNDAHTAMIANIRGMITHLGNASNLILDTDLDSYYLIDATLGGVPQLQDRIQEVITFVEPILHHGTITQSERSQLAVYAAMMQQSDLDRTTSDVQTAINEDPNFYGLSPSLQKNLPPATSDLSDSVSALIADLKDLSDGKISSGSLPKFLNISEKALASSYQWWAIAYPEVDTLLSTRIESFKAQRLRYILIGLLVLMIASAVSFVIARSLKTSLSKAVIRLRGSADETSGSSEELVGSANNLSSAASEQAAGIQETVATLDEINAMVSKSMDYTQRSAKAATSSQETAVGGKKSIDEMIGAIEEINKSNDEIVREIEKSNQKIGEIVHVINDIASRTKVINDIVFQTKLLSFNASVEAARAGEHGKGFAVVAEEVGSLAAMSGNAAREISDMLDTSIQKVNSIVEETKASVAGLVLRGKEKVEAGTAIAQRCGGTLDAIVRSVNEVSEMVREISAASGEQARGVSEITKAMRQLDEATQVNSKIAHQTQSASASLSSQADELRTVVVAIEREIFGCETDTARKENEMAPVLPFQKREAA